MKKITLILAAILLCATACNKVETNEIERNPNESSLIINLTANTAYGSSIKVKSSDNEEDHVETIDILVFRKSIDSDNGTLDTYRHFDAADIDLSAIEIKSTVGEKCIYVIANAHGSVNFNEILNLNDFMTMTHLLQNEEIGCFLMVGCIEAFLEINTNLSIELKRMVAKVSLNSLKTNFAGSPYDGNVLRNVKVYLLNAKGAKYLYNGKSPATGDVILNKAALSEQDIAKCKDGSILFAEIPENINDDGYTNEHNFYTYENCIDTENSNERFTRLVIQADLMNKTYYYPININQLNFGYAEGNDHFGIKRNHFYKIALTILRPGSNNPDEPLEFGTMTIAITCSPWEVMPQADISI